MDLDQGCKTARDERRSAILKIAHEAFLAEGYAATSMSAIAARCGGSKATLYNYFPSKDGLFEAVVQDRCASVAAMFDRELQHPGDFADALHKFGVRFLEELMSDIHIATYRMIIAESERFPELGRTFYESGPRQGAQRLAGHFMRAIDAGVLKRGDDPIGMARAFLHLCMADLQHRRLFKVEPQPDADDLESNVARAVRMFMAAYGLPQRDRTLSSA